MMIKAKDNKNAYVFQPPIHSGKGRLPCTSKLSICSIFSNKYFGIEISMKITNILSRKYR